MFSKLKSLIRPICSGLFTGMNAHLGAAIVVFSAERTAHFIGHIVAVIVMRWLR